MKNRFQNLPFKFQLAALHQGAGQGGGPAAARQGGDRGGAVHIDSP
jgi:hypothetical protein